MLQASNTTMAYPRSDEFEDRLLELSAASRALGHPGRLALLELLAARNTCTCGELVHELPLSQATVSQHLKVLQEAGLIQGTIQGPRSCYCLDRDALLRLGRAFESWFRALEEIESCC